MPAPMWEMKGSPQLRRRIPPGHTLPAAGRCRESWSIAILATSEPRTTRVAGCGSHGIPLPPVPLHHTNTGASARAPLGTGSQGSPELRR